MSRERFEGWLKADSTLPVDRDGDGYIDMTVEIMWHTWKAAMAAETVPNVKIGNANVAVFDEAYVADLAEKAATVPAEVPMPEPAAYLYTLEYGQTVANKKVSLWKLNYPFGVCGADYLAQGDEGVSYVRETPLYAHGDAREAAGYAAGMERAAVIAWTHYMDKCRSTRTPAAAMEGWCASSAIRAAQKGGE